MLNNIGIEALSHMQRASRMEKWKGVMEFLPGEMLNNLGNEATDEL